MTPKEKAQELVNRMTRPTPKNEDFNLYDDYYNDFNNYGKQCALIAVDEIIDEVYNISHQYTAIYDENTKFWNYTESKELKFWQEVIKEIEAL